MPSVDEVKLFLRAHLKERFALRGIADPADDLSLTDSGVIDSFGLLDLLNEAEAKFSIHIDMDNVDLEKLTTFGGMASAVAEGR